MKLNYFFILIALLIFASGISFASDGFTVADYTFEAPNGYLVNQTNDNLSSLVRENNTDYTIFVSAGEIPDFETAKNSREIAGFKFIGENNYTSENNLTINQQNYMKNESYFSFYSFDINGTSFLIGYTLPVHDDVDDDDNPVDVIIESV